ncbi:MAG: formylmethanofuran--tetrahydromethanopterin N-formyltransferase [Candidatus Bathyarchaeota archaeon]|nr:MAG: formylmethanofuran--tetrahydromethanopterin N-formyltransferase [Candidatus Bathyarchaeota archaeon]
MMNVEIEDTYAEAFDGLFTRLIITAKDQRRLKKAAYNSTALPSVVINRTEGGVEKWLNGKETPDGRIGSIVQFWGKYDKNNLKKSLDQFYQEISYRIRQGILVVPTTAVFNAYDSQYKIDTMDKIGHCGDGYEKETLFKDQLMIKIPLMMGDFTIERYIGYGIGVMGGNVWFLCESDDVALEAGDKAIKAIEKIEGAITPFDICSAGSKPETKYPEIGPTTNHLYCPTLKPYIADSKVPESVGSIPEIVINGITLEIAKSAMKAAIFSVQEVKGVLKISAGNYGGKLGNYKIYLKELLP